LSLVLPQPAFEKCDSVGEAVVERQQQVDIVEVPSAPEAMCQVVPWVHGNEHVATRRAQEDETSVTHLRLALESSRSLRNEADNRAGKYKQYFSYYTLLADWFGHFQDSIFEDLPFSVRLFRF